MKLFPTSLTLSVVLLASLLPVQADEAGAKRVIADYERLVAEWSAKVNTADGVDARRALWAEAPQADEFGEKLLRQLDGAWSKDWFLDYAPTLLRLAPAYSVRPIGEKGGKTPLSAIRDSADRFHFESSKIGPLCLALIVDSGPTNRKFLTKVEARHPDKVVQGQAAMALALLSQALGDGGNVAVFKEQRLNWVKKAIIQSADVPVGKTTVGMMADNFLFSIMNLEKGMQAPDILGWNVEEQAMRLSDFKGKPVMLIFWHSRMEAAEETMAFLRKVEDRLGRRGLEILGVASENRETLRAMVKDGSVSWENWLDEQGKIANQYQVINYPSCWVLDAEGKVQFNGVPGAFAELTAEALVKEIEKKN